MNFKRTPLLSCIIFCLLSVNRGILFPAEKWNVLLENWKDLSVKKDKSIGLTLKSSFATQLSKTENFNLRISTNTDYYIENYQDALDAGRTNQSDVIIYGEYYIEGEKLIVITEIYDVLENKLKMRKYYTGVVTADIFDTIDSISADMLIKIKEVLPEFTMESEVKIKKERQTVYETQNIKVKRMFYTRIGAFADFGNKNLQWYNNQFIGNTTNTLQGPLPYGALCMGFAFRYWDFRLDVLFSNLPGLPSYGFNEHSLALRDGIPGLTQVFISYYLPWFGNTVAIGIGVKI